MPTPLGSFISKAVYQSRLKSIHKIIFHSCVKFVDVCTGKEVRQGSSWKVSLVGYFSYQITSCLTQNGEKNEKEVQTVVRLVQKYYKNKEYCIITPYDAQRNAIAKALKAENLRNDNVFNVDSFQGMYLKRVNTLVLSFCTSFSLPLNDILFVHRERSGPCDCIGCANAQSWFPDLKKPSQRYVDTL